LRVQTNPFGYERFFFFIKKDHKNSNF
jgi:hypothetical protein